mmetsp:Transcript_5414/g.15071  ORF Transcript_5414/g.15071 Transcript_5414/m.15071 type:complete len:138 (-) Transcript_5414:317-730(-)
MDLFCCGTSRSVIRDDATMGLETDAPTPAVTTLEGYNPDDLHEDADSEESFPWEPVLGKTDSTAYPGMFLAPKQELVHRSVAAGAAPRVRSHGVDEESAMEVSTTDARELRPSLADSEDSNASNAEAWMQLGVGFSL